jgi:hypothetical protein
VTGREKFHLVVAFLAHRRHKSSETLWSEVPGQGGQLHLIFLDGTIYAKS